MRTTEQIRGIYDALSKADLEEAFESFSEMPNTCAWIQLLSAMLVFQQWQQVRDKDAVVQAVWNSPLAHWQDTLMQQLGLGANITDALVNISK